MWKKNQTATSGPVSGSVQFIEQRLGVFQILGVKAFSELIIDRSEQIVSFGSVTQPFHTMPIVG